MIKFEIPLIPISVNAMYLNIHGRGRIKSPRYRVFEQECGQYIPKEFMNGDLDVEVNFYFPTKRRADVDNFAKSLLDTLVKYRLMNDDSQIKRLTLEKFYDKGKPATVIQIKAYKTLD